MLCVYFSAILLHPICENRLSFHFIPYLHPTLNSNWDQNFVIKYLLSIYRINLIVREQNTLCSSQIFKMVSASCLLTPFIIGLIIKYNSLQTYHQYKYV